MTFRRRIQAGVLLVALIPVVGVALAVRREAGARLEAALAAGVEAEEEALRERLRSAAGEVERRLDAVAGSLDRDPGVRSALLDGGEGRSGLLDALPERGRMAGLDLLRLQSSDGTILASAHFRNEFGRVEPLPVPPPGWEEPAPGVVLRTPSPDGVLEVLARVRPVELAGQSLLLVGGVDIRRLGPPGTPSAIPSGPALRRVVRLPGLDALQEPPVRDELRWEVARSLTEVSALQGAVDRWILLGVAAVLLGAAVLGGWLGSRLGRPLEELAARASRLELERGDWGPPSTRQDEVGALARVLARTSARLREDARRLREAERKATVAELARQVHHDIRNGLVPIRNVLQHLVQVREEDPGALPGILARRQGTLEASLEYLDSLAGGWGSLAAAARREPVDVGEVARRVVEGAAGGGVAVQLRADPDLPRVLGDPDGVRRILENLVRNAVEAVGSGPGWVRVEVQAAPPRPGMEGELTVRVTDSGPGLPPGGGSEVFRDFFTTKAGGTGLGLSIVRRLVMDLGGSVEAGSLPEGGASFTVALPALQEGG